jgi:amino acid transporter
LLEPSLNNLRQHFRKDTQVFSKVKRFFIGRPLSNAELHGEKLGVFWGLPIMASDAISSVAYAVEEILWVLIPIVGLLAYKDMFFAAIAIILLLFILVFSYRQTIDSYPHGGGSYTVAKENLGELPGLSAAASLIIGYILTVAVSTSAGTAAITSALPQLLPYSVPITVFMILLMTIGNLRGVKESARIFALPTYVFIASMLIMIVVGLMKVYIFGYQPEAIVPARNVMGDITLLLMIRAFAAGCSGLTGVEAVSNAVPNFAAPAQRTAKRVLMLLALFVLLIFGGTSFMATLYHAQPSYDTTVLSQIAVQVFGNSFMFYILQIATAVILIMAANTSYAGLPMLLSLLARDKYAPRQFSMRGVRLGYSNGIVALSVVAASLVVIYRAETHNLIPLYAIGVFISFSLSQIGMLTRWFKGREKGWIHKAVINGIGAIMTVTAVVSIGYSKMAEGAWIALVLMVILILLMKRTRKHYRDVAEQLHLDVTEIPKEQSFIGIRKHSIVVIDTLNKASLKAINYAEQYGDDKSLVVFNVAIDDEQGQRLMAKWEECNMKLPLIVRYSPYRDVVGTLLEYIKSEEHGSCAGDMISVFIPQFVVNKPWRNVYHGQTAYQIRRRLIHDKHIAIITVPYVLDELNNSNLFHGYADGDKSMRSDKLTNNDHETEVKEDNDSDEPASGNETPDDEMPTSKIDDDNCLVADVNMPADISNPANNDERTEPIYEEAESNYEAADSDEPEHNDKPAAIIDESKK